MGPGRDGLTGGREGPEDTAYDWPAEVDTAIAEGKRNGIKVALTITGIVTCLKG